MSDYCEHKTPSYHVTGRTSEGRMLWRCSSCGAKDIWGDGWIYFGNFECRKCSVAVMERVYCPACSKGKGPFIG
ncbi:MAG TPA: hypothetical protein VNM48_02900 [Chloroflexota bacterium]|nr:hypothetical protein [Chloroflexota bacterium]